MSLFELLLINDLVICAEHCFSPLADSSNLTKSVLVTLSSVSSASRTSCAVVTFPFTIVSMPAGQAVGPL
jgi:hypothetical protein